MRSLGSFLALLAFAGCLHQVAALVDADANGVQQFPGDTGVLDRVDSGFIDGGPDGGTPCGPDASICFGAPTTLVDSSALWTWGFSTADFNRDGIEDLIKVIGDPTTRGDQFGASLYLGSSSGGLTPTSVFAEYQARTATSGDLDGDGWPDFVVTSSDSLDLEVNQLDGSFASTTIDTSRSFSDNRQTQIADFDGDSRPDLVVCSGWGIFLFFDEGGAPGFGDPRIAPQPVPDGEGCSALAVADLNGDGHPDLVAVEQLVGSGGYPCYVVVRLGIGDGGFLPAVGYQTNGTENSASLFTPDIDGDGLPDVVWLTSTGIAFMLDANAGALGPEVDLGTDPPTQQAEQLTIADLNGDHRPDLAITIGGSCVPAEDHGSIFVFLNDGDGGFATGIPLVADPSIFIGSITAWLPAGARLPSLVVGDFCDGNLAIFPNLMGP